MPDKAKKRSIEIREITLTHPNEFRVQGEDSPKMVGYAAVFDQWAEIKTWWGDTYKERIKRGAFTKTIQENDVFAVWNHNPDIVLGSSRNKTLTLLEDDYGLYIEIDPPKSPEGESKLESVRRGDVKKMSFAFETIQEDIVTTKDGDKERVERSLLELKLWETSPVVWPAYNGTTIGARSWLLENGLDMERIASAIRSKKLRGEFDDEEIETVKSVIQNLQSLLPTERNEEPGEPLLIDSLTEPEYVHSVCVAIDDLLFSINSKG